jgi:hypothetical protein
MSYPYTNQSVSELKKDFTSGRVLFVEDPTIFTPREFLSYISEGFVPVTVTVASGTTSYAFATWKAEEGNYALGSATSTDLDTPFATA